MCKKILLVAICCCLCVPVLAVESIEALSVRVTEMEKANYVLHEDLARMRLELDIALSLLQGTVGKLDAKVVTQNESLQTLAQKTLQDLDAKVSEQKTQVTALETSIKQQNDALLTASKEQTQEKIAALLKQLTLDENALLVMKGELSTQKTLLARETADRQQAEKTTTTLDPGQNDRIALLETKLTELAKTVARAGGLAAMRTHAVKPGPLTTAALEKDELYRLRIVNSANGAITVSRDHGVTWEPVGHVLTPVEKVRVEKKLSSYFAEPGVIASTAVNAIAIHSAYVEPIQSGETFYLLPSQKSAPVALPAPEPVSLTFPDIETLPMPRNYNDAPPPTPPVVPVMPVVPVPAAIQEAAIQTDLAPGSGMFGDKWAPYQGNPVYLELPSGLQPLPEGYRPAKRDIIVISVQQPKSLPQSYVLENSYGGFITEHEWDGSDKVIGMVLIPVVGIGRFVDIAAAGPGRLGATMDGMLDISAMETGNQGGFRIVLCSPDTKEAATQEGFTPECMLVSELDDGDPSWKGLAPLFMGYLHPRWHSPRGASLVEP